MSDDGEVMAVRIGDWKIVLGEQRANQMRVWMEPFVKLRVPLIFNLRRDPFERAQYNSNTYYDWMMSHAFMLYEMQALVAAQIEDFAKFPPRQKPASFNLDAVMRQVTGAPPVAARATQGAGCGMPSREKVRSLLRAVSLSAARRQPREVSPALAGPGSGAAPTIICSGRRTPTARITRS